MKYLRTASLSQKTGFTVALWAAAVVLLGTRVPSLADYQSAVLAQSPVGYWRLNDAVTATPEILATNLGYVGAAGNGTFENDVLAGVPGALPAQAPSNTAIRGLAYLNGNRVRVPYDPVFNTNGSFTVEFWCKPGQTNTLTCPAASVEFADPSTNQVVRRGWLFYQGTLDPDSGNGWLFRIYNPPSGATPQQINCSVAQAVDTNKWYHIVGTYKANNPNKGLTLYVNGVNVAAAAVSKAYENVVTNTIPLTFGARADGDFGFFTYIGDVDEGAFYPYLLTPAQILANYQAGTNNTPATPYENVVLSRNPAGYWRLNEKLGPPTANLGSSGADGQYLYASTPGFAGPQPPVFTGFETANKAVQILTNNPGAVRTAPLAIDTNTVTITAWIKPNGPQNPYAGIFVNAGLDGTYAGMAMGLDGGFQIGYTWNDDLAAYDFPSTVTVTDGQWSFVALSVGPTQAVIYAHDGSSFQTNMNAIPHPVQGFNGLSRIGMDYIYAPYTVFNGLIDEVAVFKRTLTAGEIYTLYSAGKGSVAPSIFEDVVDLLNLSGGDTLFLSVDAGGTPTLTYQWRKNTVNIPGATGTSYAKANVSPNDDGNYDVVVANSFGTVTSSTASISVQSQTPPTITQDPVGTTVYLNGTIKLAVDAAGGGLTYQWMKNGSSLDGATNSALIFNPAIAINSGSYTVVVRNSFGSVTSAAAVVTVIVPPAGSYAAAVVADSPVSWWRLNEPAGSLNFQDAMGRNHGAWVTLPDLGVPGVAAGNAAAYFAKGANAYGQVPFSIDLNSSTITVECWVKTTNLSATLSPLASWASFPNYKGYMFIKELNEWRAAFSFGDDYVYTYVPLGEMPADSPERWNQLVFTSSPADGWTVYYNGVKTGGPYSPSGWIINNEAPLTIGANVPGAASYNNFFDGAIDEIAIYPAVLSPQRIQEHYQSALYGSNTPPVFLTQPAAQTVVEGGGATFSCEVEGSVPISLQWLKNGNQIEGATNNTLNLSNVTFADAATYRLSATNVAGTASSQPAALTVIGSPTYANVTNGLVAHLNFDGDLLDSTGRGNHGSASNSPIFITGMIGSGALSYATTEVIDPGVSTNYIPSFVNFGVRPDLKFGTSTDFSVSFWTKFTGTPGDLPFLANSYTSLSSEGYTISPSYAAGGIGWSLDDYRFESSQTINDGNWHHVLVSAKRAGQIVTYLDGQAIDTRIGTSTDLDTPLPTVIGQTGTFDYPEAGVFRMDDLGVWRRSLSSIEAYSIWYVGETYARSFDTFGPVLLVIRPSGSNYELIWQSGTLQETDDLNGQWTNVAGASAPHHVVSATAARKFYRVQL